jgi:hypothetical protein
MVNFPFICSSIPAAPAYGIYISQLIRYSRACGSYQAFLDRGLLVTRKLLNQGFLLVKLKSSLRKFYGIKLKSSNTNPTENRVELRCSGRVSSSCSTSDTRRVNLVTNPVISHERGNDRELFTRYLQTLLNKIVHCSIMKIFTENYQYNANQLKY